MIWFYAAHGMSLRTAKHSESWLPHRDVACSSSSNSSLRFLPLVPLLRAIFQTDLLSKIAESDCCLVLQSVADYLIKKVNSCFHGEMLLMWSCSSRKCLVYISSNLIQHFPLERHHRHAAHNTTNASILQYFHLLAAVHCCYLIQQ